jgi:general secretion pathway protein A
MYEQFFKLTRTPFTRDIPVQQLFLTKSLREALSRLRYTAERRLVMMMTGDPGVGKSTILRCFKHELDPMRYETLYLNQTGATLRSFYEDILTQLRLEPPNYIAKIRTLTAKALLERYQNHHRTPVLLLDEAHEMPDELFISLKGLLNYDCDSFSPFALVLIGTRRLSGRLALQKHEALSGRIHMSFHLASFTQEETMAYVQHHLQTAGADRPIFSESALRKLHLSTGGNSREINKVTTMCLISAALKKMQLVDEDLVNQIIATELNDS